MLELGEIVLCDILYFKGEFLKNTHLFSVKIYFMKKEDEIEKDLQQLQSIQTKIKDGRQQGRIEVSHFFANKEKVVDIADLKVVYNPGKLNEAIALEKVTFDVRNEEYVTLFGPSGCGKSTVLNVVAGLEISSFGKVFVAEEDMSSLTQDDLAYFHRNKVGMIFQQYNLIPTLSVLDNVTLPLVFEKKRLRERRKRGREMLKTFGLEKFEKRFPQELSGGQQQRVGIARALINDPPIILADEAVGNLDSESAKNVLKILDDLNRKNKKTIISVTHNPEHLHFADRIFYMKDGKIIKVEVNKEKQREEDGRGLKIEKRRTELDLLLQAFPDLSTMQLHTMLAPFKAKMLVAYFLSRFESKEVQVMEDIVKRRLLGHLNEWQFFQELLKPSNKGGLNMKHPVAEKFTNIVNQVYENAEMLKDESDGLKENDEKAIHKVVNKIRISLLEDYEGDLSLDQVSSLNRGIEYRVLNKIGKDDFMKFLDQPFSLGGVGLNKRTAKRLSRKMELIMLVEFGQHE